MLHGNPILDTLYEIERSTGRWDKTTTQSNATATRLRVRRVEQWVPLSCRRVQRKWGCLERTGARLQQIRRISAADDVDFGKPVRRRWLHRADTGEGYHHSGFTHSGLGGLKLGALTGGADLAASQDRSPQRRKSSSPTSPPGDSNPTPHRQALRAPCAVNFSSPCSAGWQTCNGLHELAFDGRLDSGPAAKKTAALLSPGVLLKSGARIY